MLYYIYILNVTRRFYVQRWIYYAVCRTSRTFCFVIPCVIHNTCQYYSTELYEPRKTVTSWRMLRCGHCNNWNKPPETFNSIPIYTCWLIPFTNTLWGCYLNYWYYMTVSHESATLNVFLKDTKLTIILFK
jgi:hypothetical protein